MHYREYVQREKLIESEFLINLIKQEGYKLVKFDSNNLEQYNNFLIKELEKLNQWKFSEEQKIKIKKLCNDRSKTPFDFAQLIWGDDKFVLEDKEKNKNFRPKLIDFENFEKNKFYVAQQVSVKSYKKAIFDLVIFINGIPLIIFELKKPSVKVEIAINQLHNYRRDILSKDIFRFSQILIASNGDKVKLLTNNINEKQIIAFVWNKDNQGDLNNFIKFFLNKKNLINYLKNSVVFRKVNKKLVLLRPYQKRAVDKILSFVLDKLDKSEVNVWNNKNNGYVWHATGSGKTITSFKTAEILSNNKKIDKVIFLVDRRDLSAQTVREFSEMTKSSFVDLDMFAPSNSNKLFEALKTEKFIITTIQKLSKVLKEKKDIKGFFDKKFVFIIDECHRSQAGMMGLRIRQELKNSIMIGFTGTPIFEEKSNAETAKIFGEKIDVYNVLDALKDKNVLGFHHINYYYDKNWDRKNFETVNYAKYVSKQILEKHSDFTQNKKFNAILTVESTMALKYFYEELSKNSDYFVTAIFSRQHDQLKEQEEENIDIDDNADINNKTIIELKKQILKNYNNKFFKNEKYTIDNFDNFIRDVQIKFKNVNQGIDILIVIDMLLTGYDSKTINTLYVAKKLHDHNLIQAFSRTNRIYDEFKHYGNIVNFAITQEEIDKSIKIYSEKDLKEIAKQFNGPKYDEILSFVEKYFENLQKSPIMQTNFEKDDPSKISNEKLETFVNDLKEFLLNFENFEKNLSILKTFDEYNIKEIKNYDKEEHARIKEKLKEAKKIIEELHVKNIVTDEEYEQIEFFTTENYITLSIDYDYIYKLLGIDKLNEKLLYDKKTTKEIILLLESIMNEVLNLIERKKRYGEIDLKDADVLTSITNQWYTELIEKLKEEEKDKIISENKLKNIKKEILQNILLKQKQKVFTNLLDKYPLLEKEKAKQDFESRLQSENFKLVKSDLMDDYAKKLKYDDKQITKFESYYVEALKYYINIEQNIKKIMEKD